MLLVLVVEALPANADVAAIIERAMRTRTERFIYRPFNVPNIGRGV
jgi:hypothetical protein